MPGIRASWEAPLRHARIAGLVGLILLVPLLTTLSCGFDKSGFGPRGISRLTSPHITYDEGGFPYIPEIPLYDPATGVVDSLPVVGANGPFEPSISPDGTRIAFSRTQSDVSRGKQIVTMAIDGSDLRVCTADSGYSDGTPRWSPDSRRIAFTRMDYSSGYDVFVVNADGTGLHNLTQQGLSWVLDWSPVGNKILVQQNQGGNLKAGTIPAAGGAFVPIINEQVGDADYSPDGTRIAAIHVFPANRLYLMNSDGTNLQTLVDTTQVGYVLSCSWYPDGKSIVISAIPDRQSTRRRLMIYRLGQASPELLFPDDTIGRERPNCGPKP